MCLKYFLKDKEDVNDYDGVEDIWCKIVVVGVKVFKIDFILSGYEIFSRILSKCYEWNFNVC